MLGGEEILIQDSQPNNDHNKLWIPGTSINETAIPTMEDFTDLKNSIVLEYSESSSYNIGDYVWHNSVLYRCMTAIPSGEAWTAAHWTQITVGGELSDLKNQIIDSNLTNPALVDKKYVKYDNGTIYDTNSYVYIEASGISTYHKLHVKTYITSTVGICFYTAQDAYISGVRNTSEQDLFDADVDVPDGADIIRVSCLRTERNNASIDTTLKTVLNGVNDLIGRNASKEADDIRDVRAETADKTSKIELALEASYNGKQRIITIENPGYIGATGNIESPTANNQVYTNLIPVSDGEEYDVSLVLNSSGNILWLAYATYNNSRAFISRTVLNNATGQTYNGKIRIDSSTKYVAFTYSTHDGAVLTVTKPIQSYEDIQTLKESKVDNPYAVYTDEIVVGSITSAASADTARAKTKPILGVGALSVKNVNSSGYVFVLRIWSDTPYGTLLFDSGWLTTDDYTYDVDGKYFVVGFAMPNKTSTVDLDAINAANIDIRQVRKISDGVILDLQMQIDNGGKNNVSKIVKSIAHRGDDIVAPQCTAPAYIAARKAGFEIAENDLWISQDGQFVMWHDTTLALLGDLVDINGYLMYTDGTNYYWVKPDNNAVYTWSGSSYVSSSVPLASLERCAGADYGVNDTYAEHGLNLDVLKRIDFGVYKDVKFAGTQILTFDEWVLLCKQLGMEIYIDRKLSAYTDETLTRAANIVKKHGMGKYSSWLGVGDGIMVNKLRAIIPDARVGVLIHPTEAYINSWAPYNTGRGFFFNGNAKSGMTESAIQLGVNAGFDVEVWFVDTNAYTQAQILETIRTAVSYGVTGMTLDHVMVDDAFEELLSQYD